MTTARERLDNLFPDLDFDPLALREKYRQERDKRVREDGESQYIAKRPPNSPTMQTTIRTSTRASNVNRCSSMSR